MRFPQEPGNEDGVVYGVRDIHTDLDKGCPLFTFSMLLQGLCITCGNIQFQYSIFQGLLSHFWSRGSEFNS